MTQTDFNVANASGAAVRADINAHLDAVASLSSGATAPATTFPNQWWLDTSTNILKQRDNANTAWVNVASKSGANWIPYRNGTLLGDAAEKTVGTSANNVVQLDGSAKLPAVDGSQLTGVTEFDTSTAMLFQQTSAPTGWTKQMTHNNKAIRLVTGGVGSGGTHDYSTVFGTGKTTANHTISIAEMPSHVHRIGFINHAPGTGNKPSALTSGTVDSLATGGGGGHNHTLSNLDLKFVDFIIATKDA